MPPLASSGEHSYPFDARRPLARQRRNVIVVDGNAVAEEVGDHKVAGVVLVGALAARLPFDEETWRRGDRQERAAEVERPEPGRLRGGPRRERRRDAAAARAEPRERTTAGGRG